MCKCLGTVCIPFVIINCSSICLVDLSTPGAPIIKVFPSLLIAIVTKCSVSRWDHGVTPVSVWGQSKCCWFPSAPDLTNISTLPAFPGANELTASISPLSLGLYSVSKSLSATTCGASSV